MTYHALFIADSQDTILGQLGLSNSFSISWPCVFSDISLSITVQRVWLGRTFSPSASTCTFGDSLRTCVTRAISDVSFFIWLKLAIVQMGTY